MVFLLANVTEGSLVNEVVLEERTEAFQLTLNFEIPVRHQSHSPAEKSKNLRIQLRPLNFQNLSEAQLDVLRQKQTLDWDHHKDIPLKELIYEGGDPEQPEVTMVFTENVETDVYSSVDLRSLIIVVKKTKTPRPAVSGGTPAGETMPSEAPVKPRTPSSGSIQLPDLALPLDKKAAELLQEANQEVIRGNLDRAIQIYTKIVETAKGDDRKSALELLGFVRERKGQLAHAKAEYERYLKEYPNGPDSDRVRQRLLGIVTAGKDPKKPLQEITTGKKTEKPAPNPWKSFGSFSQFYSYDQTTLDGGEKQVNRSDLSSDLDYSTQWKNDDFSLKGRFSGNYLNNFMKDEKDKGRISNLSFEAKDLKRNLSGKFGRQSRTTGGVLGRFDGVHLAGGINPQLILNGVYGYPVETTSTSLDTDKRFYGISLDMGTLWNGWDFSAFAINQENHGLTDRRAVGAETRYFDSEKGFFNLIDYDIYFQKLGIFLLNGQWKIQKVTTLNFVFDYRQSPLLTLNNAILGQGVGSLDELFNRYSVRELKALAMDRTAASKSVTMGATHEFSEDLMLSGDLTLSDLEGTPGSGGVDPEHGSGLELYLPIQLIHNHVFVENDSFSEGVRFVDRADSDTYTFSVDARFPYEKNLRFIPKCRFDYRDSKKVEQQRYTIKPIFRVDYHVAKWGMIETEIGMEWLREKGLNMQQDSLETFLTVGYRLLF